MFYKHKGNSDGYLGQCKDCVKARVRKHRAENIDKVRQYDRDRGSIQKRVDARKKYAKTDAYKVSHSKANRNYRDKNPAKYFAHRSVQRAIKIGAITKKPCEVCNSNNSEAHHDDYSKVYKVRWLCDKHHKEWHKENDPII